MCQKLRKAIESEGPAARIEGLWWQLSLTERTSHEPSAVSLLRITRDRDGALALSGRSWQEDGSLSARYWSEATKEKKSPPTPASERAAAGGNRRDSTRVRRSRGRVFHHSFGR